MSALLEIDGVSRSFGAVQAVHDASFSVAPNSITALIGPNGSGKTTLFNVITGYLKADRGIIRFNDQNVTGASPATLYRRGLSRTFQQARVFSQLTVQENLVVASGFSWSQLYSRRINHDDRQRAGELLDEFRLSSLPTSSHPSCRTGSASCSNSQRCS